MTGSRYEYRYGKIFLLWNSLTLFHPLVLSVWRPLLTTSLFVPSVQGHCGAGALPDHNQTVLQTGTGDVRQGQIRVPLWRRFTNGSSCSGYHLCVRHHKRAVLSASGQVGQRRGRGEAAESLASRSCVGLTCLGFLQDQEDLCLFFYSSFILPIVCSGQGAEGHGRKQVWRGTQEAGHKRTRKQGGPLDLCVCVGSFIFTSPLSCRAVWQDKNLLYFNIMQYFP